MKNLIFYNTTHYHYAFFQKYLETRNAKKLRIYEFYLANRFYGKKKKITLNYFKAEYILRRIISGITKRAENDSGHEFYFTFAQSSINEKIIYSNEVAQTLSSIKYQYISKFKQKIFVWLYFSFKENSKPYFVLYLF